MIGAIFCAILLAVALSALGLCVLGLIFRKSIGHDILGWHSCDVEGHDGASFTGTCKYCGKKCMMDSQGNWF